MALSHENAKYALVRRIPNSFERAIQPRTKKERINVKLAQKQHDAYCDLLKQLGLDVIVLAADERHPDCCFTEDTSVVYDDLAVIGRLGAKSRRGEESAVARAVAKYRKVKRIQAPGTLEGGDVLKINAMTYIGISRRTNQNGIRQLRRFLGDAHQVTAVQVSGILHLKTGINYLGNGFLTHKTGVPTILFKQYRIIQIPNSELRKASFLPFQGKVVIPADCPDTIRLIGGAGFEAIALDYSEIRKAQAGLTCASIIF